MLENLAEKLKLSQQDLELCPLTNVFNKIDIQILTGNCIYGWRRGDKWLYIGLSEYGLNRITNRSHHILDIPEGMYSNDKIYVWYFPHSEREYLYELERLLIEIYKPELNKNPFKTKTDKISKKKSSTKDMTKTKEHLLALKEANTNPNLIRIKEAKEIGISKSTLYKWSMTGKNPEIFTKIGNVIFVDVSKYKQLNS